MAHRTLWLTALVLARCSRPSAPEVTPPSAAPPPPAAAPSAKPAAAPAPAADVISTQAGEIRIHPLHHATFALDFAGKTIVVDPVKDASFDGVPKAVAVLLTDIHPDHLDPAVIEKVSTPETVIVAPPAVAEKLPKSFTHVLVMKNGDTTTSKAMAVPAIPSLGIEAVPMYNEKRGPAPGKLYHDKGRGNGYVLTFGGKRIYISGDTECTPEMKALKDIDVAFVCMNLPYTMPPKEAVECIRAFSPKIVYPYHFRGSDPEEVSRAFKDGKTEVRIRKWY